MKNGMNVTDQVEVTRQKNTPVRQRPDGDFVHIGEVLPEVAKEIARRLELRERVEAERGSISDEEFLEMVERSGGVEL